ncbi:UDP-glucose 4-epimerase [Arthrobacter sp. ok909]|uniref:UDP-glucose 4-epimerase GalE n=1 Tax=Arthrobacter sp. ok909 TaxID=1761746 RepID=UPI00088DA682|nr:UDP-glucose 4-epimerase GalE [Arthrobacter sp. ok909]SDP43304.1 UDP-glucose 4-epimerase [Arthrobacter sp. ok909]
MTWLITGAAGYIGAHVLEAFTRAGIRAVALDSLVSGHRHFVPASVPFIHASILDCDKVTRALQEHRVSGVVHLAGYKYAGKSVTEPLVAYEHNVTGTALLLKAMDQAGVRRIVFSSSAAVYGTPPGEIVTEDTPTFPESPYGETKLIGEWLIRDQGRASGLTSTALRYFNVVGSGDTGIYDSSPHNLFPLVLAALKAGKRPKIFGTDYDTPDGTCVRDYIHVSDLAKAHVAAAQELEAGGHLEPVYNLGSGAGISVREIMDTMAAVTGRQFRPELCPRRPGDPPRIVAMGDLAARDLGWKMRHSLEDMVASAFAAAPQNDPANSMRPS